MLNGTSRLNDLFITKCVKDKWIEINVKTFLSTSQLLEHLYPIL